MNAFDHRKSVKKTCTYIHEMKIMLSDEFVNMYIIIIIYKMHGLNLASKWLNFVNKCVHSGV
jgi:hypothetical protein